MSADKVIEILKACRKDWTSRPEIDFQTGINKETIARYVEQLLDAGVLVEQPRKTFKEVMAQCESWRKAGRMKEGDRRRRCRRFRLAEEWGGPNVQVP